MDDNGKVTIACPHCEEDLSDSVIMEVSVHVVPFIDKESGKIFVSKETTVNVSEYDAGDEYGMALSFRCPLCGALLYIKDDLTCIDFYDEFDKSIEEYFEKHGRDYTYRDSLYRGAAGYVECRD